uniref:Uncharacterized protein n=1 Tax=Anopheles epiroticus TaxID=199890 RepID=A0A182PQ02_9DIPT
MEPPIQTEYLRSGGAMILILMVDGAKAEGRLEQRLGAAEPLIADGDDLSVREFVRLLQRARGSSSSHLLLKVQRYIAQLLLDVAHNFPLSGGSERVATLGQDLHQVVGQIATSQIQTQNSVRESVAFVDRYRVGDTIARIHHDTGGTTGGVQRQHSLDGHNVWCQIFSMSSQFDTMPCSIGYFSVRIPRLLCASSPTYESFWPIPTITP